MEPGGALGGYFLARASLAHSRSGRHLVELASGCALCCLIARRDCVEIPYGFCGRFLRKRGMVACACSRVWFIGAWATSCVRRRRRDRCVRVECTVEVANQPVCGFRKPVENFFKKVLDRNRRSVNIVDAPFTGN